MRENNEFNKISRSCLTIQFTRRTIFFWVKKIDLNIIYMKVYEEYSEQIQNQFKWKYVNGFKQKTM